MFQTPPRLSTNLLIGGLQLVFWLFFRPAAWHSFFARQPCPPHLTLLDLAGTKQQQGARTHLLGQTVIGWLLPVILLVGISLLAARLPVSYVLFSLASATLYGLLLYLLFSLAVSLASGIAGGSVMALAVGFVSATLLPLSQGFPGVLGGYENFPPILTPLPDFLNGLSIGLLIPTISLGAACGAVGFVEMSLRERPLFSLSRRKTGNFLVGTLLGGLLYGVIIAFSSLYVVQFRLPLYLLPGLLFGGAMGLAIYWRVGRVKTALILGGLFTAVLILSGSLISRQTIQTFALRLACEYTNCAGYSNLYYIAIPLLFFVVIASSSAAFVLFLGLGQRLVNPSVSVIASILGVSGTMTALYTSFDPTSIFCPFPPQCPAAPFSETLLIVLLCSLGSAILLLVQPWWRSLLLYPLIICWNLSIWQLDHRRVQKGQALTWLWKHSAFWDSHQRLHLWRLDDYLLWLMAQDEETGRVACTHLANTPHRWAVQRIEVELDARHLEQAANSIQAIASVFPHLVGGQTPGQASNILHAFHRLSQDVSAALQQFTLYHQRLTMRSTANQASRLQRELTQSGEPWALRFLSIAQQWQQTIVAHEQTLADTAVAANEIDNPYIFGVPLTAAQEIFVGREDISRRIEQLLHTAGGPPLLLYGQRRMGKTSLLRNLRRLLPSTYLPLFVDGEALVGAEDGADFLYMMAWQMSLSAEEVRASLPPLSREQFQKNPFTRFIEWLHQIEIALPALGCQMALFVLDEVEAIDVLINRPQLAAPEIMRLLRRVIQHQPSIKMLLVGSHTLAELGHWASQLINVQVVKISFLADDAARQLVERPLPTFPLCYEPAALEHVLTLTHRHPYLLQLLCYEIVSLKNSQPAAQRLTVTVADVETAVPHALETGSFFFIDIERNQIPPFALPVLQQIARAGEGQTCPHKQLVKHHKLKEALAILQQRDLITAVNQQYRIQVELIRRWFA